jgi:precorrin-6B methylase 2
VRSISLRPAEFQFPMPSRPSDVPDPRAALLLERSFVPAQRDVPWLLAALSAEDDKKARAAGRALLRVKELAVPELLAAFEKSQTPLRARIVRLLGQALDTDEARGFLLRALVDRDPKAKRMAVQGLGRLGGAQVESALRRLYDTEETPALRKAIVEAVGRIGNEDSSRWIASLARGDDETEKVRARALLMLKRGPARSVGTSIDPHVEAEEPVPIVVWCRAGFEEVLQGELLACESLVDVKRASVGTITASLVGALAPLLDVRSALGFGFRIPPVDRRIGEPLEKTMARAITSAEALRVFTSYTTGVVRYRIELVRAGKQRALVWSVAAEVARTAPNLINDPNEAPWELRLDADDARVFLTVVPRALEDERFEYREEAVPAASHPTVAVALARLAAPKNYDAIWDPFCGGGTELIECARLAPRAKMFGSDLDPRAVATAQANAAKAGFTSIEFRVGDALDLVPPEVTLIVSNPPMGRRVGEGSETHELAERFIVRAARILAPGGKIVWLSPNAVRTRNAAERMGLTVELERPVDLGGFDVTLQVIVKSALALRR